MSDCLAEDELLELATGRRALGETPASEAHLADCGTCSSLLSSLLTTPDPRAPLSGRTLGPYRLDSLIGAGAMGEVYRAWDLRLHRHVAVKVLDAAPERVGRLAAEGRAAASIAHPNVVTVFDTGVADDRAFIVSELVDGEQLRSVIDRGPIPRGRALDLLLQLTRGLAAAHGKGVVHRDLKPQNLVLTEDGTLKILDFGLAKISGDRDVDGTEPGTLLGTAGYLAPEQARGEAADARSDLFAVGAIAYELLTGRRAFAGATFAERLSAVLRDTPPPIDDPVGPIVARCLEKDPKKRMQSAQDLGWLLEGLTRRAPPRPAASVSRRVFLAGAAATGVGGLVLGRALAPTAERPRVHTYVQQTFRHGRVASARFTQDGGSLLYSAAWDDQPLRVFTARLGGGGTRPLDLPSGQVLAVSSRGELALSIGHHFVEGFHQEGQLALAPLEGGEPRGLGLDVQHADFTPDGTELAIVRSVGGRFRLELPAGRVLFEAGWIAHPRISPDGRQIACLVHDNHLDDRGSLVVLSRDGGTPRRVAGGFSSIDGLAWKPGGRGFWISASLEGGNNAVRALDLGGGALEVVPSAGRLRLYDVDARGQLAVAQSVGRMRMMGKAAGADRETDLSLSDVTRVADLSADGKTVLFIEFGDAQTANGCHVRSIDGGTALRVGEAYPHDLADDGRGVLAELYGRTVTLGVFPLPQGATRRIPLPAIGAIRWAKWGAGGAIVLCAGADETSRLWRVEPDGRLLALSEARRFGPGAVAADGRTIVVSVDDRLLVFSDDPVPRELPARLDAEVVCGLAAHDEAVFVRTRTAPIRVRRIALADGSSRPVLTVTPPALGRRGIDSFVISADGEAYVYSYGQELSRLYTAS
jgi:eukaryotic-like serine/threonine-protein kinase